MSAYLFLILVTSPQIKLNNQKSEVLKQVSSSRGLIFGDFAFSVSHDNEEWISASSSAIVMPSATHSIKIDCQAEAIFVIEKECVFRRMLDGISYHFCLIPDRIFVVLNTCL